MAIGARGCSRTPGDVSWLRHFKPRPAPRARMGGVRVSLGPTTPGRVRVCAAVRLTDSSAGWRAWRGLLLVPRNAQPARVLALVVCCLAARVLDSSRVRLGWVALVGPGAEASRWRGSATVSIATPSRQCLSPLARAGRGSYA